MENIERALLVLQEVYRDRGDGFATSFDAAQDDTALVAVVERIVELEQLPSVERIHEAILRAIQAMTADCGTNLCRALRAYKKRLEAIRREAEDIATLLYYEEIEAAELRQIRRRNGKNN